MQATTSTKHQLGATQNHTCIAPGCSRHIKPQFDFCYPCFNRLPGDMRDLCVKHKQRAFHQEGNRREIEMQRHRDEIREACDWLRRDAAERQGGRS